MTIGITLTPAPGSYPQNSLNVSATKNDAAISRLFMSTTVKPALAKYIAYDTFGNPFIAVLSDGAGNVVFDGGFPKFYNNAWVAGATYATLNNRFKYMVNAFNWCANPAKTDKKILLLGDKAVAPYLMTGTAASDFKTTFDGMCAIGGYTPTYVVGNPLPALSYSYLDQFACVVVMSSNYGGTADALPASLVANLLAFREAGNGIIIVTDHNGTSDPNEKVNSFQRTANQLANQFGANFYGNVDRVPVSVDYLIANYGNHPLWANMTGDFFAGTSEGIIQITTFPEYVPPAVITLTGPGYRSVNFLAEYADGSFQTQSYSYALNIPNPVTLSSWSSADTWLSSVPNPGVSVADMNSQKPSGLLVWNTTVVGDFNMAGPTVNWYGPNLAMLKGNNQLEVRITSPVGYSSAYTRKRQTYDDEVKSSIAEHNCAIGGAELSAVPAVSLAESYRLRSNFANLIPKTAVVETKALLQSYYGD